MEKEWLMQNFLDWNIIRALAMRTFRHSIESPIAYVVAIFFYGFVGGIFGMDFFTNNQGSIEGVGVIAPWLLWFVVPALTMGLISEELRSGTYEQLSTLPIRDWEIVLGKFIGFALLSLCLVLGLAFYPLVIAFITDGVRGLDWGATLGVLAGLYLLMLVYGAMGLYASSMAKNQVVALIMGMIFCTILFFIGQFYFHFPGFLSRVADFAGVVSHLNTLNRGVWDLRDLLYFLSVTFIFLYFTVQKLTARRF